jgi:hypothetical protein
MDKDFSKKIIRNTFENKFDRSRFAHFIVELLNLDTQVINEAYVSYNKEHIQGTYQPYIESFEKIASYEADGNSLDILIVKLTRQSSIERARTMQRNFIAWYLKGNCDGQQKDAALAAFVSPNEADWRFSYIKMDYSIDEDSKGRVKISEQFSPAKRWSFLVGSNEGSHTAQAQLLDILKRDDSKITLDQLEEAFNVEKVTKEFFAKYRELFFKTKEALDEILVRDSKIKTEFELKNIETVDFTKKLLGQIVFLYFLQKKGWFGVSREGEWGTGPKKFLRELFEGKHKKYKNFFNDILEPLFYEALRVDRGGNDDYYNEFNCKIPFLNGGLFDPIGDYDWVKTEIDIPNRVFSNPETIKGGDIGTGILDIFDRYNFTVQEDEPLEKEVAVDPEMLGKVFENLLEVKDRKSKGTYYTPREIVHYMCKQSLINYLDTELAGKAKKDDIENLVNIGEKIGDDKESSKSIELDIFKNISGNAVLIDDKLASVKVCDPAVGSGAFLVGMMSEIVRTRNVLSKYIDRPSRSIYELKRESIENSLYGVDIDPGAVEICKLRLWLSLIVDEEDIKQIKPLPNLDYKIVCGNSLLGIDKQDMFVDYNLSQIEKIKLKFFSETDARQKQKYKLLIEKLIVEVTHGHKEFDFEIYFSEVFIKKGGFDIVIANPPYVSYGLRGGQKMSRSEKEFLRKTFPNFAEYKISLFAIFMGRGLQIAKVDGGLETFIVPDSFLLGRYFSKIREYILRVSEIKYILLLPFKVFDATVGFSVVYLLQRKKDINLNHNLIAKFAETTEEISKNHYLHFSYPQSYFNSLKHKRFRLFFDSKVMELISKIEKGSKELGIFMTGHTGIRSLIGQKKIISTKKSGSKWQPGLISGSQIMKYKVINRGHYINIDPKLLNKGGWNYDTIHNPKLLVRQTGDTLIAAIDYDGFYHLNNVHSFALNPQNNYQLDILYLLALFNSKLLDYYYKKISLEKGRTMAQTDIETLENLPIKYVDKKEQEPIINTVCKILKETKDNDYLENIKQTIVEQYEKKIDRMVYKLYDLTPEEIEIVENSVN